MLLTAATSGAIDTKSTSTSVCFFVFSTGVFGISVVEDLEVSIVPDASWFIYRNITTILTLLPEFRRIRLNSTKSSRSSPPFRVFARDSKEAIMGVTSSWAGKVLFWAALNFNIPARCHLPHGKTG
ncbi:hypothetical protein L1887_22586 [Cichorium endivia]|nr:hypothetical protein L1887_22586 [Cichorium endivia]